MTFNVIEELKKQGYTHRVRYVHRNWKRAPKSPHATYAVVCRNEKEAKKAASEAKEKGHVRVKIEVLE